MFLFFRINLLIANKLASTSIKKGGIVKNKIITHAIIVIIFTLKSIKNKMIIEKGRSIIRPKDAQIIIQSGKFRNCQWCLYSWYNDPIRLGVSRITISSVLGR